MRATRPLKLIEIPSTPGRGRRFFAKVPDGMKMDHAVSLANAIIKRANQGYASTEGDYDIGAVYDMIARDLAAAGFVLEARLEVQESVVWDQAAELSADEQRILAELDAGQEVQAAA